VPKDPLIRRRRIIALLSIAAAAAVVAASLAFTTRSDKNETPARVGKTAQIWRHRQHRAHPEQKLEARADRAAARFAEIGLPLYCGGGSRRLVALTLDDGPSIYTARDVLPVLGARHARATFFVLGRHIAGFSGVIRKELGYGALGDHTWNHASLPGLNRLAVKAELGDTQHQLQQLTGLPVRLFRPPYGAHNAKIDRQVRAYGMLQVLWSLDSHDWKGLSPKAITKRVAENVRPGSIVLMHDIQPATVHALPKLVRALHHRGFRLVSVPELLALDPPSLRQLHRGFDGCR
jgi:peptidoglycan/xylan/chitin deacetylase (PgdA/CDA1 family)